MARTHPGMEDEWKVIESSKFRQFLVVYPSSQRCRPLSFGYFVFPRFPFVPVAPLSLLQPPTSKLRVLFLKISVLEPSWEQEYT